MIVLHALANLVSNYAYFTIHVFKIKMIEWEKTKEIELCYHLIHVINNKEITRLAPSLEWSQGPTKSRARLETETIYHQISQTLKTTTN